MAKKIEIDSKKLLKMVEDGVYQKDIMDKLGFKTSTQLKVAYANALMESGKVTEIKSGRVAGKVPSIKREVTVNKRGSLIIPKVFVNEFGLNAGDTLHVRASKVGLSLKKM